MDRKQILIVGREASGKTYFAEKMARAYAKSGKGVIIFNKGNPKDFEGAEECEFISISKTKAMLPKKKRSIYSVEPKALFYKTDKGVLPFSIVGKHAKGRILEFFPIASPASANVFFKGVHDYCADTMLLIDDSRYVLRNGVPRELGQLLSTKRHGGRRISGLDKYGIDVVIMLHSVDLINPELIHYSTHLVMFAATKAPDVARLKNHDLEQAILRAHKALLKSPKYHYAEIPLRGANAFSETIQKPV